MGTSKVFGSRIRQAADLIDLGWCPPLVRRREGDQLVDVDFTCGDNQFRPMVNIGYNGRGEYETFEYVIQLDIPAELHGVRLEGQALQAYLITTVPVEVYAGDRLVLSDPFPVVATGPATFTVVDKLVAGDNGQLRIAVHTGRGEVAGESLGALVGIHFGTESLTAAFRALDTAAAQMELAAALADDGQRDLLEAVEA